MATVTAMARFVVAALFSVKKYEGKLFMVDQQ